MADQTDQQVFEKEVRVLQSNGLVRSDLSKDSNGAYFNIEIALLWALFNHGYAHAIQKIIKADVVVR